MLATKKSIKRLMSMGKTSQRVCVPICSLMILSVYVQEILASYGYPDCEIDLLTDIDEQGGIFIKKANIILPGGAVLKEAAVEKLQNLLGDAVIDIRTGSTS